MNQTLIPRVQLQRDLVENVKVSSCPIFEAPPNHKSRILGLTRIESEQMFEISRHLIDNFDAYSCYKPFRINLSDFD